MAKANPNAGFNDRFWMTGEAWGHGVFKSDYYQNGFDAMINFDFQDQAKQGLNCFAHIEPIYAEMNRKLSDFNVLSYLSSHDTRLFFHSDSEQNIENTKPPQICCCFHPVQCKSIMVMKVGGHLVRPVQT